MTDLILRETRAEDYAALSGLWQRCFGDPTSLIEKFFALLPELGMGVTAEYQEKPVGAAYALTGLRLVTDRGAVKSCAYLYAVAVDEACRGLGIGGRLTLAAAEAARRAGAEILCTLPAEDSLYAWYEKLMGTEYTLRRRASRCKAAAGDDCLPIGAAEYAARREALLRGKAHMVFPEAYLAFQRALCTQYGGGFYAVCGGIAAAYLEEGSALVRELILPEEADRERAAAALAGTLGTEWAVRFAPDPHGDRFIASTAPLPQDCQWNLALD